MNQLQLNKILSIIIIILSCIIIYFIINKYENFISNDAIQNIGNIFSTTNKTVSINRLGVSGNVNFTQLRGIIVAWSGPISKIPSGWGLCDGTVYTALDGSKVETPDLRSKFIIGTSIKYPQHIQYGEENHVLTINEMPSHAHSTNSNTVFSCPIPWFSNYKSNVGYLGGDCAGATNDANYNSTNSSTAGDGQAHNNMPPFYTLAYIIKL